MLDDFEKIYVSLLAKEMNEYTSALCGGDYETFESYKQAAGFVQGINFAFEKIAEAKRLLKLDENQLEEVE